MVAACIPAEVGLPRNHRADPVKAGRAVIIGIHEALGLPAVMTRPCAVSESALTSSMVTCAPAGTMMRGLTRPAMRKVSSGPPEGLATTANLTVLVVNVTVFAATAT